MFKAALFMLLVLVSTSAMAQGVPLETDRPDQTESPATVPAGWVQLEGGGLREVIGSGNARMVGGTVPNTLTKLGLTKWIELRLIAEREVFVVPSTERAATWAPVEAGFKVRLATEHGLRPRTSLIAHCNTEELPGILNDGGWNFRFTMQNSFSERLSLGYNLGVAQDHGSATAQGLYTASLSITINDAWGTFVEGYGFVDDQGLRDHRFDTGFTFKPLENVQLDCSGGRSFTEPIWFLSAGVSIRFAVWNREG